MARRNKNSALPAPPPSPPSSAMAHFHSQNLTDLLEPAVDGPPSPESIRAFSQQVRQSSVQEKHRSRQTASSGSSSLLSLVSLDRPPWEHAPDGHSTLSRRSSGRSTASSMQPRERADSVQIFGKNLFNRKIKLRRDSSAQSSSASSSVYSTDMSLDTAAAGHIIPSIFSRRKPQRPGSIMAVDSSSSRPQISAPYNFQHVAHTDKDGLSSLHRSSRVVLPSDFSALRASQVSTSGALKGIQAEDLHSADISAETLPTLEEDATVTVVEDPSPRSSIAPASPSSPKQNSPSPPRKSPLKHSRSQEQIRAAAPPPRPPRFDDEAIIAPPIPPPRVSSRVSLRIDGIDGCLISDTRPQTSAGIPARLAMSIEEDEEEDDGLQMRAITRESQVVPAEYRFSRILSISPEESNWPLSAPADATLDSSLADVPEEEERSVTARSRLSVISSHSSLRGSHSVPLLRQLSVSHAQGARPARPPSNASDTLGHLEFLNTQPAPGEIPEGGNAEEFLSRESWEDDIDYCYEHEAEADCNYAWDRPSFDISREDDSATPVDLDASKYRGAPASPGLLDPRGSHDDVPALSPASQVSMSTATEALTPVSAAPTAANFSLPNRTNFVSKPLHTRSGSDASTFKESQGFNLSPSLLIPGTDYHRQMHMLDDREWYQQEDDSVVTYLPYQEPVLTMDRSALLVQSRTSASTVASADSEQMGSDRHYSTASVASTALTNLSTSSVDIQGLAVGDFHPLHKTESASSQYSTVSESATTTRRNFSHIMPTSPRKTKDEPSSAAAATGGKLIKVRKEPASPAPTIAAPSPPRRRRAKTLGQESMPKMGGPTVRPQFVSYPSYNLAFSRI